MLHRNEHSFDFKQKRQKIQIHIMSNKQANLENFDSYFISSLAEEGQKSFFAVSYLISFNLLSVFIVHC